MPVNFVAGGIQQAGKKKKKALQADDEKGSQKEGAEADQGEESDDSAASGRPAFGQNDPGSSNSSSEEERPTLSRKQPSTTFQHRSHIASERNVGAWEQHTRGIGAKLLLQMGYEPGKGLGKDLQGISHPVQAHVRKGRGAIGAYGPETAASIGGKTNKSIKVDEDVREAKEFKDQLNKWRKGSAGGAEPMERQGKRYYYKSVEEVIAKGHTSGHLLSEKLSKKLGTCERKQKY